MEAVVAIPVRDEEIVLGACLDALLRQTDQHGTRLSPFAFGIVLLLNNCTDGSADRARACLAQSDVPFVLADVRLPPERANAGAARRLAMDIAALWLERSGMGNGLLLTTDADSLVPRDWVARNLEAIRRGSGAVAGRFSLDTETQTSLPLALLKRLRLEQAYEARLVRLAAQIDPRPHDPWPNHRDASGASYAVTLEAYRAIGGLPEIPCGEDRALAQALDCHDIPIRHAPDIVVVTSARLKGRAKGGSAETLRARCEEPDMPGDITLEPLALAAHRFSWRRRLRAMHASQMGSETAWWKSLHLPAEASGWTSEPHFGAFWAKVETASPLLSARALRPSEMPAQITAADMMLSRNRDPSM